MFLNLVIKNINILSHKIVHLRRFENEKGIKTERDNIQF